MIKVTATDFKNQAGKYVDIAASQDVIIVKNGKEVALLTNINAKKKQEIKALRGIISDKIELRRDVLREQRTKKL